MGCVCGSRQNTGWVKTKEMPVQLASQRDFFAGLMFTVVGLAFALGATQFTIGSAARMGPGYFPLLLGVLLALLGALITFKSFTHGLPGGDKVGAFAWRPLGFVLLGNLAFGALLVGLPSWGLPAMGLLVAIFALVFIVGMARKNHSFKESLLLAVGLALGCYLAFVFALDLRLPVWPEFLSV